METELETGFSERRHSSTWVQYSQHGVQYAAVDYWRVKDDFVAWLRSRGLTWDNYVKALLRYLEKFSRPIGKPMDVVAMFSGLNASQTRHLVSGLRNLFNFYEAQGHAEKRWLDLLRRNLPKTSIGVDLRVPSEKEIVESLKRVAEKDVGRRFLGLYSLLLDSGLRLTEAVKLFDALKSAGVKLEKQGSTSSSIDSPRIMILQAALII